MIAPDAERAVVARVLDTAGEALMEADFLRPEHFATRDARLIFETALGIWNAGGKPDRVVIAEILRDQGVPSPNSILENFESDSRHSIADAAKLIQGKWLAREVVELARDISERGEVEDPYALLDEIERRSIDLRPESGVGLSRFDPLSGGKLDSGKSVATGFGPFDAYLGGLGPGRLITVASRPGIGKTTTALNFGANAARAGKTVALYSLEMSVDELAERLIINDAHVDSFRIKGKMMHHSDVEAVARALWRMQSWKIYIDDSPGVGVYEIGSRAKKLAHDNGLDLIIVDYLQLIDPPEADSRVQELAEITRYLKRLARELKVPVVALSQLNRQSEMRDGEPRMSDLRESGSIENDSDQILALWRTDEDYQDERVAKTRVKVLKNRHGPVGDFMIDFIKAQARFEVPS